MAHLGASVFTCGRSREALDAMLAEWASAGLSVRGCVADVSDSAGRQALVEAASKHFEGVLARAVRCVDQMGALCVVSCVTFVEAGFVRERRRL